LANCRQIERHESRRVDRQLCDRAGRQGDPKVVLSFVSLKIFDAHAHSERIAGLMDRMVCKEGEDTTQHDHKSTAAQKSGRKITLVHVKDCYNMMM
jgi:preprotein translocase subunit SecA